MKKRVLIVIPAMNIGGAEKSLVELSKVIDYEKYTVDLLLLESGGVLLDKLDGRMNIKYADEYTRHVFKGLKDSIKYFIRKKRIKDVCMRVLMSVKYKSNKTQNIAYTIWNTFCDNIPLNSGDYDIAIAYLQGISEYYVVDKTKAKKKILWMHTSFSAYSDNNVKEKQYIDQFDKVVCVSNAAKDDFVKLFPEKKNFD